MIQHVLIVDVQFTVTSTMQQLDSVQPPRLRGNTTMVLRAADAPPTCVTLGGKAYCAPQDHCVDVVYLAQQGVVFGPVAQPVPANYDILYVNVSVWFLEVAGAAWSSRDSRTASPAAFRPGRR